MSKILLAFVFFLILLWGFNDTVYAHVTVKPTEVGIASRQIFTVSVPTEEDNPTTSVRLVIPEGLQSVRPNVKQGWKVEIKKVGEGDSSNVTEIVWSGGVIPTDMRDEFVFSAQAPSEAKELAWKAYQTYQNGKVVAWDQDPKIVLEYEKNKPQLEGHSPESEDPNEPKPYSITSVKDDLEDQEVKSEKMKEILLIASTILSIIAIGLHFVKR